MDFEEYLWALGDSVTISAIKEAFAINFLPTAQIWIDMVKDRNTSSHEYNMDKVDLMLEKISTSYYDEITRYKEQIGFINE